jgi:hypothetical protein
VLRSNPKGICSSADILGLAVSLVPGWLIDDWLTAGAEVQVSERGHLGVMETATLSGPNLLRKLTPRRDFQVVPP